MKTDEQDTVRDTQVGLLDYDQFCEGELFQGLQIKPLTKRLVYALIRNLEHVVPVIADFGVKTHGHHWALKDALLPGIEEREYNDERQDDAVAKAKSKKELRQRLVELDDAYGDSAKLNAYVRKYAPYYAERVHFEPTPWDYIYFRVKPEKES